MMNIIRVEFLLILIISNHIVVGQNLYRSNLPDSILYSEKIEIPSFENDFNKNTSFHFEVWRQNSELELIGVSKTLFFESNDTLYYATRPSVFRENILPNFKSRNKKDKVVKLDFTIRILTETPYFDSIYNKLDSWTDGYGIPKYDLKKIKVEKIDTTLLFNNQKMTFNYCCMLKLESRTTSPKLLTVYYFFDKGKIIYRYRFFSDNLRIKHNYMNVEFYSMTNNQKYFNSMNNDKY